MKLTDRRSDWLLLLLVTPIALGLLRLVLGNATTATTRDIVIVIIVLTVAITTGLRIILRRGD